ncbi:MAG TPA: transglutaminase domain-containing protein [Gemmatales bacterium]|nr:transglutaminase domain-containing protein [Gemmatales bacterium]
MPKTSQYQQVDDIVNDPTEELPGRVTSEPRFGNRMRYVEGKADEKGQATVSTEYRITRKEVTSTGPVPTTAEIEMFLKADKMVPIEGKPLKLIEGKNLPGDKMELARVLYDTVNGHMKYSKEGTGWGRGDSNWACDSKFGNCTDFHSLFISLARAKKIPAKFEIGFSVPEARGAGEIAGYHCWAFFQPESGKGWVPVDISEANKNPKMAAYYFGNLTENRLTLSTGRDIVLEPAQAGPPLNFFIYPYVEVDGKPLAAEKIKRLVKFKDVE